MAEAVAADGAGIGVRKLLLRDEHIVFDEAGVVVVVHFFLELGVGNHHSVGRAVPVAVLVRGALRRGDELGEHSGQRVDLMAPELGARGRTRRILVQHSLEPEHEAVAHLPAGRGALLAGADLGQGIVQRGSPSVPGRECDQRVLVGLEERLAEPGLGSLGRRSQVLECVRRERRDGLSLVHSGST